MKKFFLLLVLLATLASCASKKNIVYLQKSGTISDEIYEQFAPKIQQEDLITIAVSAADIKATIPFNQQNPYQMNAAAGQDFTFKPTYLVDNKGEIDFPVLGKLKIGGLTRLQATDLLRKELSKYIVDPGVNLTFANFKVTLLGEVTRPGSYTLPQERVTVLEALGLAGDMTIRGVRSNVLLIRETNGEKKMERLDLTSDSLLASPYYYLAQNDVLYVEPNGAQIRSSSLGQNTNVLISVSSVIISILTLVVTNSRR
ncbi:polysaccharide biosynthesis/export family protein [Sphingobacterium paludis]|jgi:polysaccharide biosynthesis/export protein|uniref:Polysaccharide export outer membrane protein n=1 Tax=Sphingobacterium paludis TaxID=1476465 RepID=A0A4V3E1L0_9SPHI|nr:polysaccharide biosynthesis/export family protein [Sphingobacterium paludis]TDS13708.1 polysaccharide export outer membrane protein [Sphingobacterium paludis]